MKKIIKIVAIAGIYLMLSVSLIGVAYAATTTFTGTLLQTISAGADTINCPDLAWTELSTPPATSDAIYYPTGSSGGTWGNPLAWDVLSAGVTYAQIDIIEDGLDGESTSQPLVVKIKNGSISGSGVTDGCSWSAYEDSSFTTYTTTTKLFDTDGCTALSGSWSTSPSSLIRPDVYQAADTYKGVQTCSLTTI